MSDKCSCLFGFKVYLNWFLIPMCIYTQNISISGLWWRLVPVRPTLCCSILSRQMQGDTREDLFYRNPIPADPSQKKIPHGLFAFSFFLFCHHNPPRPISSRLPFPLFAPQLSALSMYHPFRFIFPPKITSLWAESLTELSDFSSLSARLLSYKDQIICGGSILLDSGERRRVVGLGQYLLFWRCVPPSPPTTTGWSSGWVGGLWCCKPGWPPQKHTSAPRICPGS